MRAFCSDLVLILIISTVSIIHNQIHSVKLYAATPVLLVNSLAYNNEYRNINNMITN